MTARQVVRVLRQDGWVLDRQTGSHMVFVHPTKPNIVVVPNHGSRDIPIGTLNNIWRQAQIPRL